MAKLEIKDGVFVEASECWYLNLLIYLCIVFVICDRHFTQTQSMSCVCWVVDEIAGFSQTLRSCFALEQYYYRVGSHVGIGAVTVVGWSRASLHKYIDSYKKSTELH